MSIQVGALSPRAIEQEAARPKRVKRSKDAIDLLKQKVHELALLRIYQHPDGKVNCSKIAEALKLTYPDLKHDHVHYYYYGKQKLKSNALSEEEVKIFNLANKREYRYPNGHISHSSIARELGLEESFVKSRISGRLSQLILKDLKGTKKWQYVSRSTEEEKSDPALDQKILNLANQRAFRTKKGLVRRKKIAGVLQVKETLVTSRLHSQLSGYVLSIEKLPPLQRDH